MPRTPRVRTSGRAGFRDRHGRGPRSSTAGPHLPFLRTRLDLFDDLVASTAHYLRDLWPDDLDGVVFEVADLPRSQRGPRSATPGLAEPAGAAGQVGRDTRTELERWQVDRATRRITLYRLPIERLAPVPEWRRSTDDEWEHRVRVEGYVFRAVADLLGKDPWELAPDRYRDS